MKLRGGADHAAPPLVVPDYTPTRGECPTGGEGVVKPIGGASPPQRGPTPRRGSCYSQRQRHPPTMQ